MSDFRSCSQWMQHFIGLLAQQPCSRASGILVVFWTFGRPDVVRATSQATDTLPGATAASLHFELRPYDEGIGRQLHQPLNQHSDSSRPKKLGSSLGLGRPACRHSEFIPLYLRQLPSLHVPLYASKASTMCVGNPSTPTAAPIMPPTMQALVSESPPFSRVAPIAHHIKESCSCIRFPAVAIPTERILIFLRVQQMSQGLDEPPARRQRVIACMRNHGTVLSTICTTLPWGARQGPGGHSGCTSPRYNHHPCLVFLSRPQPVRHVRRPGRHTRRCLVPIPEL